MIIEKQNELLTATSGIHLSGYLLCGRPYVYLSTTKDSRREANTIYISILDDDDFDIGIVYYANSENFTKILHELLNWMYEHERDYTYVNELYNVYEIFPELGCKRKSFW